MTGMAEVARQIRIARRLYERSESKTPWIELCLEERRPFIDQSCQPPYRDDDGYENQADADANFVALDFETANENLSSICQVGVVEFRNDLVIDAFTSLVNPQDYFSGMNIWIHGINSKDVVGAPTFKKIYPELAKRLSGKIVVSHTPFDRSVLCQAIARHRLAEIECRWLDSARVVRRTWLACSKRGYSLNSIASKCGVEFRHHHAFEDARAAGLVLLRAIAESGISLEGWITKSLLPIGGKAGRSIHLGNPSGALFGENLVFTGALKIPRREAAELAARIGCAVTDYITKKTSILVTGDQDIVRLSAGQTKSSKHRKAEALIEDGSAIRIIGESDFMALCIADNGLLTSVNLGQHQPAAMIAQDNRAHVTILSA